MQPSREELPEESGDVLDTRWPLTEFPERVYGLVPEIEEISRISRELLERAVKTINSVSDAEQTTHMDEFRESLGISTAASAQSRRLSRSLAFVIDDPEEYGKVLYEAWEAAETARMAIVPGEDPEKDERKEMMRAHMLDTAGPVYREAQLIMQVNHRYRDFGHEERAQLLQLLLRSMPAHDETNRAIYSALAGTLCAETPTTHGKTPMHDLIDRIKAREMDDALWWSVISNPDMVKRTGAIQKLTSYVLGVISDVAPDVPRDKVIEVMGLHAHNVPNGESTELHIIRNMQSKFLEEMRAQVAKVTALHPNINRPEAMKEQLARMIENVLYEEGEQVNSFQPDEQSRVTKRRRSNLRVVRAIDKGVEPEELASKEAEREPRALTIARSVAGGYESDETGAKDEVQVHIDKYCRDFGNPPRLRKNLEDAVTYIRAADSSTGKYTGIKKYRYRMVLDGNVQNVYEIKPAETGIADKSPTFKQSRILFFMDNEKVALIRILHRSKVPDFERNMGLGSSRRG